LENGKINDVDIIIEHPAALNRVKYVITGFYGLGLCGYLTTKFLYDAAYALDKAQRLAIVWSESIPPIVEVDDTGKFRYPIEMHMVDASTAVLLFRYQPSMNMQVSIADRLTELAKNYGFTLILCGGIDVNALPKKDTGEPDIVYVCNKAFEDVYIATNSWDIRKSPPEIVVSGGIALILMYADRKGVPAVSLLTPTVARTGYMDYKASLKLAKKLVQVFGIDVELSTIEERVQEIEARRLLRVIEEKERRRRLEEIEELEEFGIT